MYFSTPDFGRSLLHTSPLSFGIETLATGRVSQMQMALDFCQTKNICQRPPLETITCRGGRSGFLVRWVRGWWLWKYYAGFKWKSFKIIEKYIKIILTATNIPSCHIWSLYYANMFIYYFVLIVIVQIFCIFSVYFLYDFWDPKIWVLIENFIFITPCH